MVNKYEYNDLVFSGILGWYDWKTVYHRSRAVMIQLSCGHVKSYSLRKVPKTKALCYSCTYKKNQSKGKTNDIQNHQDGERAGLIRAKERPALLQNISGTANR